MATIPALGTCWQRKPPGREVVVVRRVWRHRGRWTVRAHPVKGGKPLVADADWFTREAFRHVPGSEVPGG